MMNLFKKFAKAYKENQATIICGMSMMCGNSNVYPLYRALTENSNK